MKPMKMFLALGMSAVVLGASAQMSPGAGMGAGMPADAGGMPCQGVAGRHHYMMGQWGGHMAQMSKELHDKLKLNADQETAWKTLVETMKPPAGRMPPDFGELEKLTAPERMEKMMERMKLHQEAMGEHLAAMKTFYSTLSPEQQKVFDTETLALWKKRMGEGPRAKRDLMPKAN